MQVKNGNKEGLANISEDLATVDGNLPLFIEGARCVLYQCVFPQDFLSFLSTESRLQCVYAQTSGVVALKGETIRHITTIRLSEDGRTATRSP